MRVLWAGVVLLLLYFYNEWAFERRWVRTRVVSILPLLRRVNLVVAICGIAAVLVGLISLRP